MPFLHIRTINASLDAREIVQTMPTWMLPKNAGVRCWRPDRAQRAKERNRKGVIIEVRLEQTGGKLVDRFAVTSSVGDLKTL